MSYRDYQNARDAAWRILLDCGISRLPVDLNTICHKLGVHVLSYDEGAELIERAHLYRIVRRTSGLAFYFGDDPVILFDEMKEFPEVMFTVAHELGHLIFAHVSPEGTTRGRWGEEWKAKPEERAADRFAVRLLAPACVLWGLNVHTAEEIIKLCRIPEPVAKDRAKRMAALYKKHKFLTSPLERAVYHQFFPYLDPASSGTDCHPES